MMYPYILCGTRMRSAYDIQGSEQDSRLVTGISSGMSNAKSLLFLALRDR